jgi:hypothetical protein
MDQPETALDSGQGATDLRDDNHFLCFVVPFLAGRGLALVPRGPRRPATGPAEVNG